MPVASSWPPVTSFPVSFSFCGSSTQVSAQKEGANSRRGLRAGSFDSARSGFRLLAPASLTPTKRLKFDYAAARPKKMRVGNPKPPLCSDDDDNKARLFLVAVGSDALQQFEWLSYLWQVFDAELRFELRQLDLLQFLPLFQQVLG